MSGPGPEWRRLLESAAAALERERRTCSITDPTTAERHLISGITGTRRRLTVKALRVDLAVLDAYVSEAFGTDLRTLVRTELGIDVGAARRRRLERAEGVQRILAGASDSPLAGSKWFGAWLEALRSNGTLATLADEGRNLNSIIRVLESLPADDEPLPVIGERMLGDTKALMAGPGRTTLLRALALWRGADQPEDSASERELLEWAGIVSDDLASQVLVLNVPVEGGVVSEWMRTASGVPFRLTLHQLRLEPFTIAAPVIWVVENPSVLRTAANELGPACPPLVCTEGVPSAAVYRLLGAALDTRLRWRADFDWAGLRIVARALERFPNAEPWRMTSTDYREGTPGIALRGRRFEVHWDKDLSYLMDECGRAVMEESLLDLLLIDLASQ